MLGSPLFFFSNWEIFFLQLGKYFSPTGKIDRVVSYGTYAFDTTENNLLEIETSLNRNQMTDWGLSDGLHYNAETRMAIKTGLDSE